MSEETRLKREGMCRGRFEKMDGARVQTVEVVMRQVNAISGMTAAESSKKLEWEGDVLWQTGRKGEDMPARIARSTLTLGLISN
jgi:hypothetical protein